MAVSTLCLPLLCCASCRSMVDVKVDGVTSWVGKYPILEPSLCWFVLDVLSKVGPGFALYHLFIYREFLQRLVQLQALALDAIVKWQNLFFVDGLPAAPLLRV